MRKISKFGFVIFRWLGLNINHNYFIIIIISTSLFHLKETKCILRGNTNILRFVHIWSFVWLQLCGLICSSTVNLRRLIQACFGIKNWHMFVTSPSDSFALLMCVPLRILGQTLSLRRYLFGFFMIYACTAWGCSHLCCNWSVIGSVGCLSFYSPIVHSSPFICRNISSPVAAVWYDYLCYFLFASEFSSAIVWRYPLSRYNYISKPFLK